MEPSDAEPRWRTVDRALRRIAARRAALDAEEARWLREAEELQIWKPLGMVSALDYLERVLGYAPRTAQERLRVARALGWLPQLDAALADGTLSHSAVRELTRVVKPATEARWIEAAVGKNLRQIEELVADHREGDDPDDPPDPEARTHVVRFELGAETYALLRQARMVLDDEHGTSLSPEAFIGALCNAVLDGAPTSEPTGRAKFQIAITTCRRCQQGWQEGAGAQIPIDSAAVERAHCDAQHIGSINGNTPERAHQDIPSSVMRFVWRRDGGRCRADGCRSARGLEVHHIVHREHGGSHDALNCVLLCSSCHLAHHRGLLAISGTADHLIVRRHSDVGLAKPRPAAKVESASAHAPDAASPVVGAKADAIASAHVGATKLDLAILETQAKAALVGLGWKPAIARVAIAAALAELGYNVTLERLIFESLRRCPVPKA
ncbi:MAG TPA: HNH endonuclease signature motif containing protein [Kofleriaceae bacterium]|nr:HNH endonuclease signature motif containing protein [Kofleriaceae bacterium]